MKKGWTYFGKDDVSCVILWGWGRGGGGDEGWFLFGRFLQVYCEHCADYWGWLNYIFLSWCHPHSSSLTARCWFFDVCFLLLCVLRAPLFLWIHCNLEYVSVSFMFFWQFRKCVWILQLDPCSWVSRMRSWLPWHQESQPCQHQYRCWLLICIQQLQYIHQLLLF